MKSKEVSSVLSSTHPSLEDKANDLFWAVMTKAADEQGVSVDRLMEVPAGRRRRMHDDITFILFDLRPKH
jgi:hypothetical protein